MCFFNRESNLNSVQTANSWSKNPKAAITWSAYVGTNFAITVAKTDFHTPITSANRVVDKIESIVYDYFTSIHIILLYYLYIFY